MDHGFDLVVRSELAVKGELDMFGRHKMGARCRDSGLHDSVDAAARNTGERAARKEVGHLATGFGETILIFG